MAAQEKDTQWLNSLSQQRTQQAKHMTHMGYNMGPTWAAHMGFANEFHIGPLWATHIEYPNGSYMGPILALTWAYYLGSLSHSCKSDRLNMGCIWVQMTFL